MILQNSLINRIEGYIAQLKQKKDLSDFKFRVSKSNTTKSIYIEISTQVNGITIKRNFRISDHRNSKVKTKIIKKATSFKLIKRKIDEMILALEKKRLQVSFNVIQKK